jgi:hypothetical protein
MFIKKKKSQELFTDFSYLCRRYDDLFCYKVEIEALSNIRYEYY